MNLRFSVSQCHVSITLIPDLCSNILCLLSYLSKFPYTTLLLHNYALLLVYCTCIQQVYRSHFVYHSTERFAIAILLRLQRTTLFDGNNPETQVEQDDTSNEGKKPNPAYIYNFFFTTVACFILVHMPVLYLIPFSFYFCMNFSLVRVGFIRSCCYAYTARLSCQTNWKNTLLNFLYHSGSMLRHTS